MEGGSIKTGPFGTVLKAHEYTTSGVPLISVGEIRHGYFRIHEKTPRISEEVSSRLPDYVLRAGDIVFGRKGAVDRSARVSQEQDGWFLGSDGIRLRLSEATDSRFMAYQLQSDLVRRWILQHATGTTMASLNQGVIERIPVLIPPLPEQRAIAHILGTLDDKIELNRKMNETLEAMARALFKSWFVDFDPVREKSQGRAPTGMDAETAKLFPSEFVESELGEIPKGWEHRTVGELSVLSGGKQLEREFIVEDGLIPVFGGAGVMGFTMGHNADGFVISVGRVGAYCGQFFAHRGKAWINNNASLIRPNDAHFSEWMFLALKHADIDVIKKGAAQPFVSNGDIANLKLLWPGAPTIAAFSRQFVPLLDAKDANDAQSKTLARTRDTLLPSLLSGELSVAAAVKELVVA
ncbi:MAG: restriction endonuclease subunit S [Polyangiaceae bacterium]|nr:restriction endonuclease subunit S [Polyangiaceae bacterium]